MKTLIISLLLIGIVGSLYASQTSTIFNAISVKISVHDSEKAQIFAKAFN